MSGSVVPTHEPVGNVATFDLLACWANGLLVRRLH